MSSVDHIETEEVPQLTVTRTKAFAVIDINVSDNELLIPKDEDLEIDFDFEDIADDVDNMDDANDTNDTNNTDNMTETAPNVTDTSNFANEQHVCNEHRTPSAPSINKIKCLQTKFMDIVNEMNENFCPLPGEFEPLYAKMK